MKESSSSSSDKLAEVSSPATPQLEWEIDEYGDVAVTLTGVPNVHLTVHGKTHREALHMFGDALEGCFMEDCPDPQAHTAAASPATPAGPVVLINRLSDEIQKRGRKHASGEPLYFDRCNLETAIADVLADVARLPASQED